MVGKRVKRNTYIGKKKMLSRCRGEEGQFRIQGREIRSRKERKMVRKKISHTTVCCKATETISITESIMRATFY
jgi:hypothetical protein